MERFDCSSFILVIGLMFIFLDLVYGNVWCPGMKWRKTKKKRIVQLLGKTEQQQQHRCCAQPTGVQ